MIKGAECTDFKPCNSTALIHLYIITVDVLDVVMDEKVHCHVCFKKFKLLHEIFCC